MNKQDLERQDLKLLDAWRHDQITADEFAVMEKRLETDAGLRTTLRELADIEEGLVSLAVRPLTLGLEQSRQTWGVRPVYACAGWLAAAMLFFALFADTVQMRPSRNSVTSSHPADRLVEDPPTTERPTTERPAAVLTRAIGVQWHHPSRYRAETGKPVSERQLRIEAGIAEVTFSSGAIVTVEGPASLRIDSAMKCYSDGGKLTACCPLSAYGFTIGFRGGQVVDLGTEFALDARPEGKTEVHVLRGEVIVSLTDDGEKILAERNLKGSSAVELSADRSAINTIAFNAEPYVKLQRDTLIRSQPVKLQFDLGHRAGLYEGTNSPAHAAGDILHHENVWNQIVGDQSGAFVMADSNICPHPVRVDYGHGDGVIDWSASPVDPAGRAWNGVEAFFNTPLCQDHRPWDFDLGLRVSGLPAATYRVYALCRSIRRPTAAYDVSFGLNLDRQLKHPLAMPSMKDLVGKQWEPGQTYAVSDVQVSSPRDWITFITRYSRERALLISGRHGRSVLSGLQIVEIQHP